MESEAEVSLCSRDVVPENSDLPLLAVGAAEDSVGRECFVSFNKHFFGHLPCTRYSFRCWGYDSD